MTFLEHAFIAHYAVPGRTAVEAAQEAQVTAEAFCQRYGHDMPPADGRTRCHRCLTEFHLELTLKEEETTCEPLPSS